MHITGLAKRRRHLDGGERLETTVCDDYETMAVQKGSETMAMAVARVRKKEGSRYGHTATYQSPTGRVDRNRQAVLVLASSSIVHPRDNGATPWCNVRPCEQNIEHEIYEELTNHAVTVTLSRPSTSARTYTICFLLASFIALHNKPACKNTLSKNCLLSS